jgi:quinol monooxygenase YgiN
MTPNASGSFTTNCNAARHVATIVLFAVITLCPFQSAPAEGMDARVVRIAKLQIDPAQLEAYNAALQEEIETSVRLESGVLGLFAVAEKENPAQITILELYADDAAYHAHLQTPHFKKYKAGTEQMVKSLTLVETTPIALEAKSSRRQ